MAQLIGTGPDQVPINGLLGDMAFQNKDSVEFSDGKGGLASLDITAIKQQINVAATDVFIYDTSKDSDGGAWRQRCQHTSWYNEELNTATRGSRREFPSVAVIVASYSTVTIYDGDDPDLPLWMVFTQPTTTPYNMLPNYSGQPTSITMLNGKLCVGQSTNYGLAVIDFLSELAYSTWRESSRQKYNGSIAERNGQKGAAEAGGPYILTYVVNDVAMTVLPNAPIDAATGLPIPTIAVATNGGVSVIKDDGTVANITASNSVYTYSRLVQFVDKTSLLFSLTDAGQFARSVRVHRNFSSSVVLDHMSIGVSDEMYATSAYTTRHITLPDVADIDTSGSIALRNIGYDTGLVSIDAATPSTSAMVCYISSKYNTGWMPGDIKGAWLSDTTQETVVGAELVTNGTFDSSITGWTTSGDSVTQVSGKLRIVRTTTLTTAIQAISVVAGKTYVISGTISDVSGAGVPIIRLSSGTFSGIYYITDMSATGINHTQWTATFTGTVYIGLGIGNANGQADFDNVSLRLADPDRSINNKGLQVFGNITKTPVAAGADLVGYSGFSTSNYFKQPPNPSMDFGSGGYAVMLWVKNTTIGCAIGRGPNDSNESMNVYFDPGTYGIYFDYGNATQFVYAAGIKSLVNDGNWHFVVCHVRAGEHGVIWVDGIQATISGGGAANSPFMNSSSWEIYVGTARQPDQPLPFGGSLALVRVSATIPSPEQILKMYNDEKHLFQENAKATLYGTSDSVTALAYDEDTNLLHVGTSSGRSVFKGLRRIDNTTDAVGNAISAVNGLVVEE